MKRMKMIVPALVAFGLAFAVAGCVVHGTTRVHGAAYYEPPQLVYVSPGVQVVYDYHEPVFYSDGFYWRYYGGTWYRSSYHSHGWVRYHRVPHAVARIDRPSGYVRYRGSARGGGTVRTSPGARGTVRDHRGSPGARPAPAASGRGSATVNSRGTARPQPAPPPPRSRDHRGDKDDDKGKVKTRDHRRR